MKRTNLLFSLLFLFVISVNAQKNKQNTTKTPASIYTLTNFEKDGNSFYFLNKKLKLSHFDFVYVDSDRMEYNYSTLYFKDHGKKSSIFISDDYNRYIKNNLIRSFLEKNDPTLWNYCNFQNNAWQ